MSAVATFRYGSTLAVNPRDSDARSAPGNRRSRAPLTLDNARSVAALANGRREDVSKGCAYRSGGDSRCLSWTLATDSVRSDRRVSSLCDDTSDVGRTVAIQGQTAVTRQCRESPSGRRMRRLEMLHPDGRSGLLVIEVEGHRRPGSSAGSRVLPAVLLSEDAISAGSQRADSMEPST